MCPCQRRAVVTSSYGITNLFTSFMSFVGLQKWSKGKMKEKVNNQVLFEKVSQGVHWPLQQLAHFSWRAVSFVYVLLTVRA